MLRMRYALIAICIALPALGTSLTPTSVYSQWNTSTYITGPVSKVDFNSVPGGSGGFWNTSSGATYENYNITGPDGNSWYLTSAYVNNDSGLESKRDGVGQLNVTLPPGGVTGIYLWAFAVNNGGAATSDHVQITFSDGTSYTFASPGTGTSFSGPITSFTLQPTVAGDGILLWEIDTAQGNGNFGSGDPSQAPEAVTFALVGGGMLVLFGTRRKFVNLTKFVS